MSDALEIPNAENLRALKEQGIIFSSPLAIRLTTVAVLLLTGVALARNPVGPLVPPDLATAQELGLHALKAAAAASTACAGTILLLSLIFNGFFLSAGLLSPRKRGPDKINPLVRLGQGALGAALGLGALFGCSKSLFGALYLGSQEAGGQPAGLALLRASLGAPFTAVIVGTVILAILVAGIARARFVLRNRVAKSSS